MIFTNSDAITSNYYQRDITTSKDPIIIVGKPPVFTENLYLSFLQGRYEVATANPHIFAPVEENTSFTKLFDKIETLSSLKDGWDKDGAEAPNFKSIDTSRHILGILNEADFMPTNVSASVEGGVNIYFVKDNKYADIECFNSGEVLTSESDRINKPIVTELKDENDVKKFVEKIKLFFND